MRLYRTPGTNTAVEQNVPVSMPRAPGALGFDIPLWVGLGTVGLWAALDAFSERAGLPSPKCMVCGKRCMPERFAGLNMQGTDGESLKEFWRTSAISTHTTMQARPTSNISAVPVTSLRVTFKRN